MTPTNKQTRQNKGFAIPLLPDTGLGLAMLIAEDEDGYNEPVSVRRHDSRSRREIAKGDFRERMRGMEAGERESLRPRGV